MIFLINKLEGYRSYCHKNGLIAAGNVGCSEFDYVNGVPLFWRLVEKCNGYDSRLFDSPLARKLMWEVDQAKFVGGYEVVGKDGKRIFVLGISGPMSIPWTQKVELFYAA